MMKTQSPQGSIMSMIEMISPYFRQDLGLIGLTLMLMLTLIQSIIFSTF